MPDLDTLPSAETDSLPSRPSQDGNICPVCGEPILSTGRGRPAKMHPECRKSSGSADKNSSPASAPRKSAGNWPMAATVENALNDLFSYAGMGLTLVNPADGSAVAAGGPAVSKALVDLGRTDKKLRRYLEMVATPGKYGPLILASLGIIVPVMVNHNLIPQIQLFGNVPTEGGN